MVVRLHIYPAIDWQSVQVVGRLSAKVCWGRLQLSVTLSRISSFKIGWCESWIDLKSSIKGHLQISPYLLCKHLSFAFFLTLLLLKEWPWGLSIDLLFNCLHQVHHLASQASLPSQPGFFSWSYLVSRQHYVACDVSSFNPHHSTTLAYCCMTEASNATQLLLHLSSRAFTLITACRNPFKCSPQIEPL